MAASIEICAGQFVVVDEEDAHFLRERKWYVLRRETPSGRQYLYAAATRGRALLHRLIMGAGPGVVVDHRDGDGLNNSRSNLRVCTHAQNMKNRRPNANKTLPKGVGKGRRATYYAQIRAGSVRRMKCGFSSPEEAARCYAEWATELHGEFALSTVEA